jgi:hypothetical protein
MLEEDPHDACEALGEHPRVSRARVKVHAAVRVEFDAQVVLSDRDWPHYVSPSSPSSWAARVPLAPASRAREVRAPISLANPTVVMSVNPP